MKLLREVEAQVNRPFQVKLAESREVIKHHIAEFNRNVAVAFSGGKDSEVVLYLCLQVTPDVPVIFNNTGVEYPETVRFVAELAELWSLNLIVTHPEKTFWECVEKFGFPKGSKRHHKGSKYPGVCCYWLKEKPMREVIRLMVSRDILVAKLQQKTGNECSGLKIRVFVFTLKMRACAR